MSIQTDSHPQSRRYRVWYARWSPYVGQGSRMMDDLYKQGVRWTQPAERPYEISVDPPILFTTDRLLATHIMIGELDAPTVESVFHRMQVDRWPEREIIAFGEQIDAEGLTHSSMCPGDIVEDVVEGRFYECDMAGWRELTQDTQSDE